MKICFIAGMLGQGGAEKQLYHILSILKKNGITADVYCFQKGEYWQRLISDIGIKVICLSTKGRIGKYRELLSYIKFENYSYIHSQHFYTNLYAVVLAWLCRTKCVGSIRNDAFIEVRKMGLFGWASLILPPVLVSNSFRGIRNAQLLLRNSRSIFYLPNCVDIDLFSPGLKFREINDPFKVIIISTIWKQKRIDRVLNIAELVACKSNRRISFEIFGDGDLFDEMIVLARSKNLLDKSVFFRGRSNSIYDELRCADILLQTSDHEGTPNSVLEAMATGLPVLATIAGDIPLLIMDGITGYCVKPKEYIKLADYIEFLYDNPSLCREMGVHARKLVADQYSDNKLETSIRELYK